ncbi:MAG: pantetheine-phosphate adenylyltransferase [Eubacteriales bacterium]|nr:pantetheine-phosphate adenylyltransferase [Eubacteriales bacterium]
MRTAIYPGSFDPITYGHLDIIHRAADVFDKVIVGILKNQAKSPLFDFDERVEMIQEVTKEYPNVEVVSFQGLLIDFTREQKADVIVRGIRAVSDFEYELMMAQTNKQLNPDVETMFLATSAKYSFLSSSTVRELAVFGGDISPFVPDYVREKICEKLEKRRG